MCARNIWLELASANIQLIIEHISGSVNVYADILSRWKGKDKFSEFNVNKLIECEWFYINDSFFYLNQDI